MCKLLLHKRECRCAVMTSMPLVADDVLSQKAGGSAYPTFLLEPTRLIMNPSVIFTRRTCRMSARLIITASIVVLSGCATHRQYYRQESFQPATPFKKTITGSSKAVCWSVKEAFLSQGYMLRDSEDTAIMMGTKDYQPDAKTDVTLRLQATCVDDGDGTSTVFATASQEVSKLQTLKQSISAGVSIATVTWPSDSGKALRVISRQTIQDPKFYDHFYVLVEKLARQDRSQQQR